MDLKKILMHAIKELKVHNNPTPELDARVLLGFATNIDNKSFFHSDDKIKTCEIKKFKKFIDLRKSGMPVSRIIGKRNFWKYEFLINDFTLDPRPDSETLLELADDYFKNKSKKIQILDLGSGSGCLGISFAKDYSDTILVNFDISTYALRQSWKNAKNQSF